MSMIPSADHPIWKLLQQALSLFGVLILAYHGMMDGHKGGVDAVDVTGGALVLKEVLRGLKFFGAKE